MQKNKIGLTIGMLMILGGCATARLVETQPGKGGVVAIKPTGSSDAREKAKGIMQETCGGKKVEIVAEGEHVIGQFSKTSSSESESKGLFGPALTGNSSSHTTQETEWRITFQCI